jgi:hypothetical protein
LNFQSCKKKYFIIKEGEQRAIIRDSESQAEKIKRNMEKFSEGKKVHVFVAEQKG